MVILVKSGSVVELDAPRSAEELFVQYGLDGEHPSYIRAAWRLMVANDQTVSGYWQWLADILVSESSGMATNANRAHAVTALRAAALAKIVYWNQMRRLESAFGYAPSDIPDRMNNEFVSAVDHLATATPDSNDVSWINYPHLDDLMKASGARL